MNEILTVDGNRCPPSSFVKKLAAFDSNLRVVWGLSQAIPFPGWVIERRIPNDMKAKVYGGPNKSAVRERFSFQVVTENGRAVAKRVFDMMPDWHPIYRVMDAHGSPITELGDFVLDFLRRNYERTLLGHPELSARHHKQDMAERDDREAKKHDEFLDNTSKKVLEHKTSVWPEYFAHGGQPKEIHEGTTFYDDDGIHTKDGEGSSGEDAGITGDDKGSAKTGRTRVVGYGVDL